MEGPDDFYEGAILFLVIVNDIIVVINAAGIKGRLVLVGPQPDVTVPSLNEMVRKPRLA